MLLLGAEREGRGSAVRAVRTFERAHARLELAVLRPVDGARRLLLGEGQCGSGLSLQGLTLISSPSAS